MNRVFLEGHGIYFRGQVAGPCISSIVPMFDVGCFISIDSFAIRCLTVCRKSTFVVNSGKIIPLQLGDDPVPLRHLSLCDLWLH